MPSSNSSYSLAAQMQKQGFESPSLTKRTTTNNVTTDDAAIILERYEKRIAELENALLLLPITSE